MGSANVFKQGMGFFFIYLLVLVLAGCGGGGDGQDDSSEGSNVGTGWLRIFEPTDIGTYQTDRPTVALGGNSFTPAGSSCPSIRGELPPGYHVTWTNNSTGATGNGSSELYCLLIANTHWDIDGVPVAMGANSITVTANDGAGNIGRDTIVVTRVPDTTPPTVVSVSPANGATGVAVDTGVAITFSEAMDPSTINATTVLLKDDRNNPVPATVWYVASSLSAYLTPVSPLAFNTTYQVTVSTGVRDSVGGNVLSTPYTFSFTTGL